MAILRPQIFLLIFVALFSQSSPAAFNKTGRGFFKRSDSSGSGKGSFLKKKTRKSREFKNRAASAPERLDAHAPRLQLQQPQQTVVLEPLFSVFMPMGSMQNGCLRVSQGQRVSILDVQDMDSSLVLAAADDEIGQLRRDALMLDQHCANIYLETMDVLVEYPNMLFRLLEEEPDCAPILVSLFAARRILDRALYQLLERELRSTHERRRSNEVFRSHSPATSLVVSLLNRPGDLQKFRRNFVAFSLESLTRHFNDEDPESLVLVIKECLDFLKQEEVPPEIVMLLRTLRKMPAEIVDENYSVLLGSMFFLRYLMPALAQPAALCDLDTEKEDAKKLRMLARALQLISNQIEPDESHDFFFISDDLKKFYGDIREIFFKIVVQPMPLLVIEDSLVVSAANMYALVMLMAQYHQDPEFASAAATLQKRLGEAQSHSIKCEEEAVLFKEIHKLSKFIKRLNKKK